MAGSSELPALSVPPNSMAPRTGVVVVVDDDEATRRLIRMWLEKSDLAIVDFPRGEEALAYVEESFEDVDAIVLDVMMPGLDGFEVLARLKSRDETSDIPVVLLTAHANEESDVVRGIETGAVDHLAKPFRGPVLVARVRALAEKQRHTRTVRRRLRTAEALATKDPLTELSNRREFERQLEREIAFTRRHATPMALLLIDLDHFKSINDLYGHPEGDRVLVFVARCLNHTLRRSDRAFRVGGEEFAVLLRGADVGAAKGAAVRLARALDAEPVFFPGGDSRVITYSGGVAVADAHNGFSTEGLFERADRALYRAKRGGRARTELEADDRATNDALAGEH